MQITLDQADFDEAVNDYLAKMGIPNGTVTFSSTSGKSIKGIQATVELGNKAAEPVKDPEPAKPDLKTVKTEPAETEETEPAETNSDASEETVAASGDDQPSTEKKSLFS